MRMFCMQYELSECVRRRSYVEALLRNAEDELERYKLRCSNIDDAQSRKFKEIINQYRDKDVEMRFGIHQRRAVADEGAPDQSKRLAMEYIDGEPSNLWQLTRKA